jgi:hypothetical protein
MNFIDSITNFLLNKNNRLSTKAIFIIFIIISFFFIDNYIGFSYYFNNQKKIEQIIELDKIISDSTVDKSTILFAKQLRTDVIKRENLINNIYLSFRNDNLINPIKQTKNVTKVIAKNNSPNISSIKNIFWFYLSSSGIFYLFGILMFFFLILVDFKTSLIQRLGTGFLFLISFSILGLFITWLMSFIPQILNHDWIFNYLLNMLIQLSIIYLLFIFSKKMNKNTAANTRS